MSLMPTFLLIITIKINGYPLLILPMPDRQACETNRAAIQLHLDEATLAQCYDLMYQSYRQQW